MPLSWADHVGRATSAPLSAGHLSELTAAADAPPPAPPAPPRPRRALAPVDPNIATLANEISNLERENVALKQYVVRQKKALVVVARLHEPPL